MKWIALLLIAASATSAAHADSLFKPDGWSALATDQNAHRKGDVLTVQVYENASATNSANNTSGKDAKFKGGVSAGHFDKSAGLDLSGQSNSTGTTGRSGQMVAQISVTVTGVQSDGDLEVEGQQVIHINGERTLIRIKGRVRRADISSANAVLSTRLADAAIDYDGTGFVSRSSKQGPVTRLFSWLGLL